MVPAPSARLHGRVQTELDAAVGGPLHKPCSIHAKAKTRGSASLQLLKRLIPEVSRLGEHGLPPAARAFHHAWES